MHHDLGAVVLRKPEPSDVEALYRQKNDPEIASLLGGFSKGYTRADLTRWVEMHGRAENEALYVIASAEGDCLGHVGLYDIDHRIRAAEFAILLGERSSWGTGIGRACAEFMLRYGFDSLQLHRIHLDVLATNVRARKLYDRLGFKLEGTLRDAQWKQGSYVDVHVMSILEHEWREKRG